ncbi:hypothetical protein NDU88_005845 [Pleurodeles waltl]|uniref:Uncharacterized protein n=1 Tax=Pleurodeles waltl TaxID=8319 RepID=A0AAV7NTE8_PLEWA|nr:hypothetical protein NDU88_005845 [Pleurodeles waltl]
MDLKMTVPAGAFPSHHGFNTSKRQGIKSSDARYLVRPLSIRPGLATGSTSPPDQPKSVGLCEDQLGRGCPAFQGDPLAPAMHHSDMQCYALASENYVDPSLPPSRLTTCNAIGLLLEHLLPSLYCLDA